MNLHHIIKKLESIQSQVLENFFHSICKEIRESLPYEMTNIYQEVFEEESQKILYLTFFLITLKERAQTELSEEESLLKEYLLFSPQKPSIFSRKIWKDLVDFIRSTHPTQNLSKEEVDTLLLKEVSAYIETISADSLIYR